MVSTAVARSGKKGILSVLFLEPFCVGTFEETVNK